MHNLGNEKAKLAGYLQSDGCIRNGPKLPSGYRYEISFSGDDLNLINDFKRIVNKIYPYVNINHNDFENCYKVVINSKNMLEDITKFGKYSSKEWEPPKEFFRDKALAINYIQGIFYGDGGVEKDGKKIYIECISKKGIEQLKELLSKTFDIQSKIYSRKRSEKYNRIYILEISNAMDRWLFNENIGLPLQKEKQRRIKMGLFKIGRITYWRTPKLKKEICGKWLNYLFSKNGVFDCNKGRIYIKNKQKAELKKLRGILKIFNINKTHIVGPTKKLRLYILMIDNKSDLENLKKILKKINGEKKGRLMKTIKKRCEINA